MEPWMTIYITLKGLDGDNRTHGSYGGGHGNVEEGREGELGL